MFVHALGLRVSRFIGVGSFSLACTLQGLHSFFIRTRLPEGWFDNLFRWRFSSPILIRLIPSSFFQLRSFPAFGSWKFFSSVLVPHNLSLGALRFRKPAFSRFLR